MAENSAINGSVSSVNSSSSSASASAPQSTVPSNNNSAMNTNGLMNSCGSGELAPSPLTSPPEVRRVEAHGAGNYYHEQWLNHTVNYCQKLGAALDALEARGKKYKLGAKSKIRIDRLFSIAKVRAYTHSTRLTPVFIVTQ